MKITVFEVRNDEKLFLQQAAKRMNVTLAMTEQPLTDDTISQVQGSEGVSILGHSSMDEKMLAKLKEKGVKALSTRTIGVNHIDLAAAHRMGIRVSHANYPPNGVADFTVMLMLMLLRKAKISVCRALVNDFSLDGMCGREMRNLTVGIIGAGKIGRAVIGNLQGFGCRILAYDPYVAGEIAGAEMTGFDRVLEESDIISLHVPLNDESRHIIDAGAIRKMKDGALIINTARGGLIDTGALISALESEKIGGAGLDTIEAEDGLAHIDLRARIVDKRDIFYLKQFPNVIFTSHYAFFTEEATAAMVNCALRSLRDFGEGKKNPLEIFGK